ncbi:MAG: TIGR02302 family protein [Alphaproteobacteria bacterium]|nr:TIGR02302 family protein [Alphaproteobacteria bacterium]MCB9927869.1 TIGR02302 family protein [Alphaproteobacteria bacterium]
MRPRRCRPGWRRPDTLPLRPDPPRTLPLESRIALAWASLWVERVWNGVWPLQAVVLALLALALSGLLPALGPWVHSLLLAAAAAWLGWTLWRRRAAWRFPGRAEAMRRLERDSGVAHRPLQALDDRPLDDSPAARTLWQAHQHQVARYLAALRPRPPQSALPRLDRFAWRAGALLALAIAVFAAGRDWRERFADSLAPRFAAAAPAVRPVVDLWLEPPAYTGHAPIFAPASGQELRFPAGSRLVARVSHADRPVLTLDGTDRPMTEEAPGQHSLTLETVDASELAIADHGRTLAAWPLAAVPDRAPSADFGKPPAATPRQALRLDYALYDDYGVASAWAELRLDAAEPGAEPGAVLRLPFPLGKAGSTEVRSTAFNDLTPHPWAGRKVRVTLHARDGAGQEGASETLAVVLPERVFSHPVARRIVAARKRMDQGAAAIAVARDLADIASRPGRFADDIVVYLALDTAFHRLRRNDGGATRDAVRDLLWDTALRLEDGRLPAAERDLRAAQEALREALARNAPADEIRRLVDELREAMRRFAAEIARRAGQQPPPNAAADPNRSIAREQLERMLDRIQALAETGARDAARQMLSQLQQMLESVRQAQRMTPQQREQAEAMTRMLNRLQEMQRRQQALIDRTFRQNQEGQPAPTGPPDPNAGRQSPPFSPPGLNQPGFNLPGLNLPNFGMPRWSTPPSALSPLGQPMPGLARDQDRLRHDLGDMMHDLGERFGTIPNALQQAEQAMRAARDNLHQGAGQPALDAEGEALAHLQQLGQALARQLSRQLGVMPGPAGQRTGGRQPGGLTDPLGREGSTGQTSETGPQIPAESDLQRARRIRDTLFERSAEPDRPVPEQDYLRRLLQQF